MAGAKQFTLVIKTPAGVVPYMLNQNEYVIGRDESAEITLKDPRVSAEHAKLVVTPNVLYIEDLGSTNGTYIDEEKMKSGIQVSLTDASIIEIDPFEFRIISDDADEKPKKKKRVNPPPAPPDPPIGEFESFDPMGGLRPPPGLDIHGHRLMSYLPEIYHPSRPIEMRKNGHQHQDKKTGIETGVHLDPDPNEFLSRFLGIFEAILFPIEWTADNFDLFLHPTTAPVEFLSWLANWYDLSFDSTWDQEKKRLFLQEAYEIYAMRGTKKSMERILEIYTGVKPIIEDLADEKVPDFFTVTFPLKAKELDFDSINRLVETHKPVHTTFKLKGKRG